MHVHLSYRRARGRLLLLALLFPALLALAIPAAQAQSSPGPVITGYLDFFGHPITAAPPGSAVIILGSGFGNSGTVQFAGFNAPIVRWSPNALRVLTPLTGHYPTRGPVTVTTGGVTVAGPEFSIDPNAPQPQPAPQPTPAPPVTGDWPVFAHDPRQLGLADGSVDPRTLQPWAAVLGSRAGTSPVVRNGIIYIGTEASGVVAIDAATRQLRWARFLGAPVRSAPAAGSNVVVVSANGLYGLSVVDGSVMWSRPDIIANGDVSPMLAGDMVYIGARAPSGGGAAMYAVNATTGGNVWPAPSLLPAGFDNRATAAVSSDLGLLFAGLGPPAASLQPGAGPSAVVALRLSDGAPVWGQPVVFPTTAPPTGLSVGWVGPPGGIGSPRPAVFVTSGQTVAALYAFTGGALWARNMPEVLLPLPPVVSTAAIQSAVIFVAGSSGRVYALDGNTGFDVAGGLSTPLGAITGTMALAGPYLYVPTTAGLVAADARSGAIFWTAPIAIASGVAVAGGIPYAATADFRLLGYASPSTPVTNPPPTIPPPVNPPTTNPPVGDYHDLAIMGIQVASTVSRSSDAEVFVTVQNQGSATETFQLRLRVNDIVINDVFDTIASLQTKRVRFVWPTGLMGADGTRNLIAQIAILGHLDFNPENNAVVRAVTVGP
jgi:outer membrane protein assembly factor BamB